MRSTADLALLALPFSMVLVLGTSGCSGDAEKPSGASSSGSSSGSSGTGGTSSSSGSTGTVPDAATPAADAGNDADTAAKKKNAEVGCTTNEQCESNYCFQGGTQSYCSLPCTPANVATVCAAPFTGSCNNKGFCKRD
jgi:hypothetical protein